MKNLKRKSNQNLVKCKIGFVLFILCFLTSASLLFGQKTFSYSNFYAVKGNGFVTLNWTMNSGNVCSGVKILRSDDSITFTTVGFFQGVCGSGTEDVSYEYSDTTVTTNRTYFYRLELNGLGYTNIVSVDYFSIAANEYTIQPHPIVKESILRFRNSFQTTHTLQLFSTDGKLIFESSSNKDYFSVNSSLVPAGYYVFVIADLSKKVVASGHIVFIR